VTGAIKALTATYGFVRDDALGRDLFFHRDDVVGAVDFDQLTIGDNVTFEAVEPAPAKGPRARAVSFVGGGVSR
jgi:cold shock CspA family protein